MCVCVYVCVRGWCSPQVDSARRNAPDLFSTTVVGPFLLSGVAATLAWWVVWPLEYMKSQVWLSQSINSLPLVVDLH